MSDRRRFLKGLTSPWGREPPIRRPTTLSRHIAQRQAGIDHNRSFAETESPTGSGSLATHR